MAKVPRWIGPRGRPQHVSANLETIPRSCPDSRRMQGSRIDFETRSSFAWPISIRLRNRRQRLWVADRSFDAANYIRRRRFPLAGDACHAEPRGNPKPDDRSWGNRRIRQDTTLFVARVRNKVVAAVRTVAETMTTSRRSSGVMPTRPRRCHLLGRGGGRPHVTAPAARGAYAGIPSRCSRHTRKFHTIWRC